MVVTKQKRDTKIPVSESTRKKFAKDFSLPIPVFKSPYFEYYVELYDTILQTKRKLGLLQKEIHVIDRLCIIVSNMAAKSSSTNTWKRQRTRSLKR